MGRKEENDAHESEEEEEEEEEGREEADDENELVENENENRIEMKHKPGVVYLAKVPPFMKPEKVKHLLSKFAKITKIYLAPEDESKRRRRIKDGGNRKIRYVEGWIEFEKKKDAKFVAESLNLQKIGGKKTNFYSDDLWNLKYLKGFKWSHLTEKAAYEKRIRAQKLRAEMAKAKKENEFFLEKVKQSKELEKIRERQSTKRKSSSDDNDANIKLPNRQYKQLKAI